MLNIIECKTFEDFVYRVMQNEQQDLEFDSTFESIDMLHDTMVRKGGDWSYFVQQVEDDIFEVVRYEGKVVVYYVPKEVRKA